MLSAHWFGKWHETVIMSNLYGNQYTENYERELKILIYLQIHIHAFYIVFSSIFRGRRQGVYEKRVGLSFQCLSNEICYYF